MPGTPVLPGGKRGGAVQVGRHSRTETFRQPLPGAPGRSRRGLRLVAVGTLVALAAGAGYYYYHYYLRVHRTSPPLTARQVFQAAVSRSAALGSVTATFTTQVGGLTVLYGSVQEQVRPTPLANLRMTTVDGADRFAVDEIVSNTEVYLGIPALAQATGKPWVGVPVPELSANASLAELAQTGAIPTSQMGVVALASKVRLAGTGTVDGVRTGRYVGTVDPTALAGLSPAQRRLLAPELKSLSGLVSFVAWIDSQHNFRKIETTATIGGQRTVTTIVCTAFNTAVQITVPLAGQVTTAPFSGLPTGLVPSSTG